MKQLIFTFLFLTNFIACKAQNEVKFDYDNFERQILSYESNQNSNITQKDFDYGKMILRETKAATKNNPENFNLADYFNILSAFVILQESETNIKIAFEKFKNADKSCGYIIAFENSIEKNPKFDIIRADYRKKLKECKSNSIGDTEFDIREYCKTNNLDITLVQKINQINIDDQKYRNSESKDFQTKQTELDKKNQKIIDSLYKEYRTYLGENLVGEKFEGVMWGVVQHSNPEMMEKYLPAIQKAVQEKELRVTSLKMLIDRYYGLKYGYQVFGSQSGFDFEITDEKTRKEIELKYGIE